MRSYLIGLIITIFFCQNIFAITLEVCQECVYKTLTAALEDATDGDVITVQSGLYKEGNIQINKSIHLKGINYPIFDGEDTTEIFTVTANDVTIEGLQIQNVGTSYLEDRAGIRVFKVKNFTIRNNRLYNTFFGIYLAKSADGRVEHNEVVGNAINEMSSGNAIHLWHCKRIKIKDNTVRQHRDGIYLEFVDQSQIHSNLSEDNLRYGLHFMFSNDDDYFNNVFRRNGAGVAVMFSKKINMWENTFELNWGRASYGLLLKEIYDAEIKNNIFSENTIGIYVEGSTRVNYTKNQFDRNGWAIKISGGCVDNKVQQNNFVANTFDLSLNSATGSNSFNGNYWSEYTGYDLNRDGIGDVPYRPVKLFNFVVNQTPETIVLLRSLVVDLINFSEKVSPAFTPKNVVDDQPVMKMIQF